MRLGVVQPVWKTVWLLLLKINILLDKAIPLLSIDKIHRKTCPHQALNENIYNSFFHGAQNWKQLKCTSTHEWRYKLLYPQCELLIYTRVWINSRKFDAMLKKPDPKGYTWYDSISVRETGQRLRRVKRLMTQRLKGTYLGWWVTSILIVFVVIDCVICVCQKLKDYVLKCNLYI